jgi:hypothetical protein
MVVHCKINNNDVRFSECARVSPGSVNTHSVPDCGEVGPLFLMGLVPSEVHLMIVIRFRPLQLDRVIYHKLL